ncbi:unnamed protein product [Periconia digitata]|uniref:Importin N-terminal domain-containing protein n=1 Tax=Periconia digitata TaxID=1303443 RepID=A0A9W4XKM9_9PLEO|nr:unnamed protein product [Periconia digitata]
MDEQQFVELLEALLLPDTERVKSATSTLNNNYYKSPASLNALLQIVCNHPKPELRQLAAVEARKLINKHWNALPADQKSALRQQVCQHSLNEEERLVRHSAARVVSAFASKDFEDGEGTELLSFLQQAATSSAARHREVGTFVIWTTLETVGDEFPGTKDDLYKLFSSTIQDAESTEVRVNTMAALGCLAMLLDSDESPKEVAMFQEAIPGMVKVLQSTVEQGDETNALQAFEVFQTLLSCDSALLQKHFGDLVKFMLEMSSSTSVEDDYRSQALAFLMQCVRFKKLKIQGMRIGEELTLKALQIVTEMEDLSTDDEDITPARSALGLLDILAGSLPPSQVVIPLLKALGNYFTSENPRYRQAGILALGMCVEGAPDFIATQLHEILPMVLHLLDDADINVRIAALNGVTRLADDLAEDVGKEHARLIPAIVKNYDLAVSSNRNDDDTMRVVRGTCNAIDSLIEGLEPQDAALYVRELVPRISNLFNSDELKTKVPAISAVGSIASAAGAEFAPFFEQTMNALSSYIRIKDSQDELDLRGVTCDTMGKMATAVGEKAFEPYVLPLMEASEEALHLDHPRLRETSYILWSTMAKLYQKDFAKYLPGAVKGLIECLDLEESNINVELGEEAKDLVGTEVVIEGQKVKVAAAGDDDDDDFSDLNDAAVDDDDWDDINGVSAIAMEKEIAAEVFGDIITHTCEQFIPYLEDTVTKLLEMVEHSYEGIRKACIGTLWRTYACLYQMAEEKDGLQKWTPGLPPKVQPPKQITQLSQLIMKATMAIWPDEMDRGTVTDINRDLAATLRLCGPSMLMNDDGSTVVPDMVQQLLATITKRHLCQQDLGEDDEDDVLEESSEYDWLVIETAMELVTCLSVAIGPGFGELWKAFEKPIVKYASSQESVERSAAVGTIAECIGNMGEGCTQYSTNLLKLLVHRLSDEDPETKSNAVYGIGLLCEKTTNDDEILKSLPTIFSKLEPLLEAQDQARLLDNTAGCVSRFISKHGDKLPIGEVLPRVVQLLPLREDYEENKPIYSMIIKLYQANEPTIQQLTPTLMPVFEKVLGEPQDQLEDETRSQLVELVKYLQK